MAFNEVSPKVILLYYLAGWRATKEFETAAHACLDIFPLLSIPRYNLGMLDCDFIIFFILFFSLSTVNNLQVQQAPVPLEAQKMMIKE